MSQETRLPAYDVVELDPRRDLSRLEDLLGSTRDEPLPRGRLPWLYLDNPDGTARIWGVVHRPTDRLAGFTAAIPRRIAVRGEVCRGWIGADFSMLPAHRSLGPALKLRRAAKDAIAAGEADLLYSHPNPRMESIHARVGHHRLGTLQRHALLIDPTHLLGEWKGSAAAVARLAGKGARAMLSTGRWLLRLRSGSARSYAVRGEQDATRLGGEYDALALRLQQKVAVAGVRDSAYLAWRWGANPYLSTRILGARLEGELHGFAVMSTDQDHAVVRDLYYDPSTAAGLALLFEVERLARRDGHRSVSATFLPGSPLSFAFDHAGYRLRETDGAVFVWSRPDLVPVTQQSSAWWMTLADRDV